MENLSPKCFISYSWDSLEHQNWVRELATQLQKNGVQTQLDQWDLRPGQDMMEFMEYSIRTSDFVLLICSPNYALKANNKKGGVGYEKSIITGELFSLASENTKFIPLLANGSPEESLPSFLKSKLYIDFRINLNFETQLEELLRHIYDTPKFPKPELGIKPDFTKPIKLLHKSNLSTEGLLTFNINGMPYNFTLPDWWDSININWSNEMYERKFFDNFVREKFGQDVGTKTTWKFALKAHALHCHKTNRFPVYIGHCASVGEDYNLAIKIYTDLYNLVGFLQDKQEWYYTYLAYEAGGEYVKMKEIGLAISWYNKATKYLENIDPAIKYYAQESLKEVTKLESILIPPK